MVLSADTHRAQTDDFIARSLVQVRPGPNCGSPQPGTQVGTHDITRLPVTHNSALIKQNGTRAKPSNGGHIVRHEQDGAALSPYILHFIEALALNAAVADSQYFVDK